MNAGNGTPAMRVPVVMHTELSSRSGVTGKKWERERRKIVLSFPLDHDFEVQLGNFFFSFLGFF